MVAGYAYGGSGDGAWWLRALEKVHERIAPRFARAEVRERVRRYLAGPLDRVERKNGWQLAEAIGELGAKGTQRLLNAAAWDADSVRDDLRDYVVEHLGDSASGVLIVDETGFLKKGTKSCGVARQYTGTAGDTVNCQVGVFLAYASDHGAAFIDRALYLPQEWAENQHRRAEAGVPVAVRFASKIALAEQMLARAFHAAVPAQWVLADSFYGRSGAFRHWLEEHDRAYAVMIPKTNAVQYQGRRVRVEQLAERLSERESPLWVCLALSEECAAGRGHWLLIRRDRDDPDEDAYWLAYGPAGTTEEALVRVCTTRWEIEEGFAQTKGEVGMNQYEVRTWTAWHRCVTLCLLAHASLVVVRHTARQEEAEKRGGADPSMIPLTVPEVRRLVLAMTGPDAQRAFRCAWSRWRRTHQAVAARCLAARRASKQGKARPVGAALPRAAMNGEMSDAEWECVRSLLPPQKPPTGRPRLDHRMILNGILSVTRTEASWREIPEEWGKWETAYKRYRLWRDSGFWQRILTALTDETH